MCCTKKHPGRFVFYQLGFRRHTEKTACRFIFWEGVIMQEKMLAGAPVKTLLFFSLPILAGNLL